MLGELTEFVVSEMAMDGEEGCTVARLDGFISTFLERYQEKNPRAPKQKVDDAFKSFVWRHIFQHPNVRVGVLDRAVAPDREEASASEEKAVTPLAPTVTSAGGLAIEEHGDTTDPTRIPSSKPTSQSRTKLLSKAAKKKKAEAAPEWTWRELPEAEKREGRDVLAVRYASNNPTSREGRLRIATDPETCLRAMIGSDIRPARLTNNVYQVLCVVTRGREAGATAIELGQQLPHDQKSIFHFVRVLTELGLVEKFRAYAAKTWTNRVLHRRYLATSKYWKDFQGADEEVPTMVASSSRPAKDTDDVVLGDEVGPPEQNDLPVFPPITTQMAAIDRSVVKSRVEAVLGKCRDHLIVHSELIKAIGVLDPTKEDRRRLNRLIDEWQSGHFIEKISVPHLSGMTPCIRLVVAGDRVLGGDASSTLAATAATEKPDVVPEWEKAEVSTPFAIVPAHEALDHYLFRLIQDAGEEGITHRELRIRLADFDVRSIEHMLITFENMTAAAAPHLSDRRITSVYETLGREKRLRWFGSDAFIERCRTAHLDVPEHLVPLPDAGGFGPLEQAVYTNLKEADEHAIAISRVIALEPGLQPRTKRRRDDPTSVGPVGRPRKYPLGTSKSEAAQLRHKLEKGLDIASDIKRLEKKYAGMTQEQWLNQSKVVGSSGTGKREKRRRSEPGEAQAEEEEADELQASPPPPKKRSKATEAIEVDVEPVAAPPPAPPPKKRGRPPKADIAAREAGTATGQQPTENASVMALLPPSPPRKRGRPSKADIAAREARHAALAETSARGSAEAVYTAETSTTTAGPVLIAPVPVNAAPQAAPTPVMEASPAPSTTLPPRKRGRPSKADIAARVAAEAQAPVAPASISAPPDDPPAKRRRARPSKAEAAAKEAEPAVNEVRAESFNAGRPDNAAADADAANAAAENPEPVPVVAPAAIESQTPAQEKPVHQPTAGPDLSHFLPPADTPPATPHPGRDSSAPTPSFSRSSRGPKIGRSNFTAIQRESDLLSLIKSLGGVAEINVDLMKAHHDRLAIAPRELFSSHGSMDRRTLDNAISGLQRRGEVRTITVIVPNYLGHQVRRQLVLLVDLALDDPSFLAFLKTMQRQAQEASAVAGKPLSARRKIAEGRPLSMQEQLTSKRFLEGQDAPDEESMREALAGEWRVIAQLHGYQHGAFVRARTLHLQLLKMFANPDRAAYSTISSRVPQDPRIFSSAIFFQDFPIGILPQIVPITTDDSQWTAFKSEPDALVAPLRTVPPEIRSFLRLGSNYTRTKIFKLLYILNDLRLLIPLDHSDEPTEHFYTSDSGAISYFRSTPLRARTTIFRLADSVELYNSTSALEGDRIPLIAMRSMVTEADGRSYWQDLENICLSRRDVDVPDQDPQCEGRFYIGDRRIFAALRTAGKWSGEKRLFNTQKVCILRLLQREDDPAKALDDTARLQHYAEVVHSDANMVRDFLAEQLMLRSEKRRKRADLARKHRAKVATGRGDDDDDAPPLSPADLAHILAAKARETVSQRARDWAGLVSRFKSVSGIEQIDQVFLDNLRSRFLATRKPITAIEAERELDKWVRRQKGLRPSAVQPRSSTRDTAPTTTLQRKAAAMKRHAESAVRKRTKRSILASSAIKAQPQIQPGARPERMQKPSERRATQGRMTRRRWDPEQDDFLRDLVAIMRARAIAVGAKIASWTIPCQLFGDISNQIRSRLIKLEQDPKEKRYLELLTEAWLQLYNEKRGTAELPEAEDAKQADVDAGAALDILRANIDKGFLWFESSAPASTGPSNLPASFDEFRERFSPKKIKDQEAIERGARRYGFMYANTNIIERTRGFLSQALTVPCDELAGSPTSEVDPAFRIREAVKMVLVTDQPKYNEEAAVELVKHFPDAELQSAVKKLRKQGLVMTSSKPSSRPWPGRILTLSESFHQTFDRFGHGTIEERRESVRENFADEESQEWPLIPTDQAQMALFEAFSNNSLSFDVDASMTAEDRLDGMFNSRKQADESIENAVTISVSGSLESQRRSQASKSDEEMQPSEGQLEAVREAIASAGEAGISPNALVTALTGSMSAECVHIAVAKLTQGSTPPRAFFAGSSSRFIVAQDHLAAWTQKISSPAELGTGSSETQVTEPGATLKPARLWTDIFGETNEQILRQAKTMVKSAIELYPGVSETTLLGHVKPILGVLELDDIIQDLLTEGKIATAPLASLPQPVWQRGFVDGNFWPV